MRSLKCSSCSAPLKVDDPTAGTFQCSHCGMVNQLGPAPIQAPHRPRGKAPAPVAVSVGLGGVIALMGLGVAVSMVSRPRRPPPLPTPVLEPTPEPPPAPVARKPRGKPKRDVPMGPENLYWLDQYISPVGVDATGDGVEDIAGAFVLFEHQSLNAYVGVIDGKTFEIVWKAGPYGDRKKATRSTGVAVKEGRLLAVNVLGDAQVHDLKTGEKLAGFTFDERDPARWICAPAEGSSVYLGTTWGGGTLTDLKTLKTTKARAPAGCGSDERRPLDTGDVWRRQAKNETRAAPKLERFDATCWFHDGTRGVMMGSARGSDAVELVGFDPVKHVETWRQPVAALTPGAVGQKPTPLELAQGKFFYTWGEDGDRHVAAIDAATGAKVWDAVSPGAGVANVTVSASRLYLVTLEWDAMPVNVFDLQSGALIARLGGLSSRY